MDRNTEYSAFVASLTYGEEMIPMTVDDANYTISQWEEEGSIEIPEGFTGEIFAEIWNEFCMAESQEKEIVLGGPYLEFEISECGFPLEAVIEKVEREYPGWHFDRTEPRYESCLMAVFTKE